MNFQDFLQKVGQKIGFPNAFDLARDTRITALERILVEKKIASQEEIESATSAEFQKVSDNIEKMPPLPQDKK